MTTSIISKEQIRAQVLKVLSGYCFRERKSNYPQLFILSPWISDVQLALDKSVFDLDLTWFLQQLEDAKIYDSYEKGQKLAMVIMIDASEKE